MSKIFSIGVLSDLHVDLAEPRSWDLARAAFRAVAAAKVDHVVVAGDLFDSASAMQDGRDVVEKYLRRLNLWSRDRLTIVPGNHDLFHTPHRARGRRKAMILAKALWGDLQERYDEFCDWIDELAYQEDVLAPEGGLFPFYKDLGVTTLLATDSNACGVRKAGNGFWYEDYDEALRLAHGTDKQRVLVMHHPPFEDAVRPIQDLLQGDFGFGFPKPEYKRLKKYLRDEGVGSILCGHLHWIESDDVWTWDVEDTAATAYMVGRTGGLHDAAPMFGRLDVLRDGRTRWRELKFKAS